MPALFAFMFILGQRCFTRFTDSSNHRASIQHRAAVESVCFSFVENKEMLSYLLSVSVCLTLMPIFRALEKQTLLLVHSKAGKFLKTSYFFFFLLGQQKKRRERIFVDTCFELKCHWNFIFMVTFGKTSCPRTAVIIKVKTNTFCNGTARGTKLFFSFSYSFSFPFFLFFFSWFICFIFNGLFIYVLMCVVVA